MDTAASRLSGSAAKLYLALVLNRPAREFTTPVLCDLTGLVRQTLYSAIKELVDARYIHLVENAGRSYVIDLVYFVESVSPVPVAVAPVPVAVQPTPTPLLGPKKSTTTLADAVRASCSLADGSGDLSRKVSVMQDIWNLVFPERQWQRPAYSLNPRAARELLKIASDSATTVFDALVGLLDGRKIEYPLGYSRSLIQSYVSEDAGEATETTELLSSLRSVMRGGTR